MDRLKNEQIDVGKQKTIKLLDQVTINKGEFQGQTVRVVSFSKNELTEPDYWITVKLDNGLLAMFTDKEIDAV